MKTLKELRVIAEKANASVPPHMFRVIYEREFDPEIGLNLLDTVEKLKKALDYAASELKCDPGCTCRRDIPILALSELKATWGE